MLILGSFTLIEGVFTLFLVLFFLVLSFTGAYICVFCVSGGDRVQVFSGKDQINFCFLVCWGGAGALRGGRADLLMYAPSTRGNECESESYVLEGRRVRKSLFDDFDNENANEVPCLHNYFFHYTYNSSSFSGNTLNFLVSILTHKTCSLRALLKATGIFQWTITCYICSRYMIWLQHESIG